VDAIDSEEKARRLARAILADIQLYNAETIARGGDLTDVIAEGRALYRGRVVPELHPLFEAMLDEAPFAGNRERRDTMGTVEEPAPPSAASGDNARWIAVAVLLFTVGVALYLFLSR
jgi:hypothetical protein